MIFPFDVEAFDNSERVKKLPKDYQRWWYLRLCIAARQNKERPGCVRDNVHSLLQQAGVTAQLPLRGELLREWGAVLACFVQTGDGYLKHDKVVRDVEQEVTNKRPKKTCSSIRSSLDASNRTVLDSVCIQIYRTYPKRVKKPEALRMIEKAIESLALINSLFWVDKDNKQHAEDFCREWQKAAKFLLAATEEFSASPAGRDDGLFAGYKCPYPASWFNPVRAARYMDERASWYGKLEVDGSKKMDLDKVYGD